MKKQLTKNVRQFMKFSTMYATAMCLAVALNVAHAQDHVGNGGTGSEALLAANQAEVDQVSGKIRLFFLNNTEKLKAIFPEFEIKNLLSEMKTVRMEVVQDELKDRFGIVRTCVNVKELGQIQCTSAKLDLIKTNPAGLFVLTLHEYLGLLGVEETGPQNETVIAGYSISKRLAPFVTKTHNYDLLIDSPKAGPISASHTVYKESASVKSPMLPSYRASEALDALCKQATEEAGGKALASCYEDGNSECKILRSMIVSRTTRKTIFSFGYYTVAKCKVKAFAE